jgi:hypothetical protein
LVGAVDIRLTRRTHAKAFAAKYIHTYIHTMPYIQHTYIVSPWT